MPKHHRRLISMPRLATALCLALAAGATPSWAQRIDTGLWEHQTQMNFPDRPEMAAQMAQAQAQLKNLPPETRKMMEQQMANMGIGVRLGAGNAVRTCVTEAEPVKEGMKDTDCTYSHVARSGQVWRGRMTCPAQRSEGEFVTTMHSSRHYSTVATMRSQQGRIEMKSDSRFVSADCAELAGKRPANKK